MRPLPIVVEDASLSTPPAEIVASLTVGQHVDPFRYSLYSAFSPFLPTVRTWGLLDCASISLLNPQHGDSRTGHQEIPHRVLILTRFKHSPIDTRSTYAKNDGGCGLAYGWEYLNGPFCKSDR